MCNSGFSSTDRVVFILLGVVNRLDSLPNRLKRLQLAGPCLDSTRNTVINIGLSAKRPFVAQIPNLEKNLSTLLLQCQIRNNTLIGEIIRFPMFF